MREWDFESLTLLGFSPEPASGERLGAVPQSGGPKAALLWQRTPILSGLPARLGPQVSLFPGEQSPEGEEDMGESQAETLGTKRELGDANKSGSPVEIEGMDRWLPEIVNHTLGFIRQRA